MCNSAGIKSYDKSMEKVEKERKEEEMKEIETNKDIHQIDPRLVG